MLALGCPELPGHDGLAEGVPVETPFSTMVSLMPVALRVGAAASTAVYAIVQGSVFPRAAASTRPPLLTASASSSFCARAIENAATPVITSNTGGSATATSTRSEPRVRSEEHTSELQSLR